MNHKNNKKYAITGADRIFLFHDIDEKNPRPQRIKRIKFHVEQDDYFGTLAAILNLLTEDETTPKNAPNKKLLEKLVEDLNFLQDNFKIIKK
ncbi:MAG: hypothetical protein WC526_04625 [Patescibacteria group bacterium]